MPITAVTNYLTAAEPAHVIMPADADAILALIRTAHTDEISEYFRDYFSFRRHVVTVPPDEVSHELHECRMPTADGDSTASREMSWLAPPVCVTLAGTRLVQRGSVRRLFVGDLAWLFYFERLGIFQMLGQILDAYAHGGNIPISNGSAIPGRRDDVVALVLETMVRQMESGGSSRLRDRESSYRRCLGWSSEAGRSLDMNSVVNSGFNALFHRFISSALEFYRDKRLAAAIRDTAAGTGGMSVATLVGLGETLRLLKRSFDSFDYGRNYANTLSGIVWVIAGMAAIRELRPSLGIPAEYRDPYEYIPAAYDILVLKRPVTPSDTNRYQAHRDCANNAREILLGAEAIDPENTTQLTEWLNDIENRVESYRNAYRSISGTELGAPTVNLIPQQA